MKKKFLVQWSVLAIAGVAAFLNSAQAVEFSAGDLSQLTNPNVQSVIESVGFGIDHRAYQPARPLGLMVGVDVGLDFTSVPLKSDAVSALQSAANAGASIPSSISVPRLSLHKGLPMGIDLGFSFVTYQSLTAWGLDAQYALLDGGFTLPSVSVRGGYNSTKLAFLKTNNVKLDLVASYGLVIAEPYAGAGLSFMSGSLDVTGATAGLAAGVSAEHSKTSPHIFIGVPFKLMFLHLTGEYDYNFAGVTTYGGKLSLAF